MRMLCLCVPFLVQIYYDRPTFSGQTSATSFVIEPGNIQIHITDWYEEGNVSGTPINKDYNTCVIERKNLVNRIFRERYFELENNIEKNDMSNLQKKTRYK